MVVWEVVAEFSIEAPMPSLPVDVVVTVVVVVTVILNINGATSAVPGVVIVMPDPFELLVSDVVVFDPLTLTAPFPTVPPTVLD